MPTKTPTPPDALLAQVRLLRLTDRLLEVAEELREARDKLQTALIHHARTHLENPTDAQIETQAYAQRPSPNNCQPGSIGPESAN